MESFRKRGVVLTAKEVEDIIREYINGVQGWNPSKITFNIHTVISGPSYGYNPDYTYELRSITATEEQHEYPETDSV